MPTIQLIHLKVPMRRPLSNARGTVKEREIVLVSITEAGLTGWGEAAPYPGVTPGTVSDVWRELRSLKVSELDTYPSGLASTAHAAVDQALTDLEAQQAGAPLWAFIGGKHRPIPACKAIGLQRTPAATLELVSRAIDAGTREVKIKIEPGHDLHHLRAVRRHFPGLSIATDANGSYRWGDPFFGTVDDLALSYLEQPLDSQDLAGHSKLRARIDTPICLDESAVTIEGALRAMEQGCADIVSLKPGLLGVSGIIRMAERARDTGVDVKIGGLVETSVGRAHALALSSLESVKFTDLVPPGWMLAADVSRYRWELDSAGRHALPESPGLGIGLGRFLDTGLEYVVRSVLLETG